MALAATALGTGSKTASGNTYAVVPSGNFAAGSMAVLMVAYDNTGTAGIDDYSSIADSLSNVWTPRQNLTKTAGVIKDGTVLRIFTSNCAAGPPQTTTTITVTFGSSTTRVGTWALWEITRAASNKPAYLTGGTASGASTAATITTGTIAVADMTIGGTADEYGTAQTVTNDSDTTNGNWTTPAAQAVKIGTTGAGQNVTTQVKVQTTTGSTQTYNIGYGTSADWTIGWISVHETPDVLPTAASLATALSTPTVVTTANVLALPTAASLTASGATPSVTAPAISLPTAASLTATTATPVVAKTANVTSSPTAGALTLTTATPAVAAAQTYAPTAKALTATGATPAVTAPALSQPTAASATATGATPAVATPRVSLPTQASLTATPATPAVTAAQAYAPFALAATITPATPVVTAAQTYAVTAATLTATPATPTVVAVQVAVPTLAVLTTTPATPTVTVGGAAGIVVLPDAAPVETFGATPRVAIADPSAFVGGSAAYGLMSPRWVAMSNQIWRDEQARRRALEETARTAQAAALVDFIAGRERQANEDNWLLDLIPDSDYMEAIA